ncbi:MAG: CRISPR-associated endonuclease Cas1 [Anaerolineae bacterium]|nr:CRISPR-associated endonuclease Cas1 [Anaerolineae bacterium]
MQLVVDTQGAKVRKDGERVIIHREGCADESAPINVLEQVVLIGRGVSVSTPLLYDLAQRGIDVVYQSRHGRLGFRLVGPAGKHSALRVRQVQVCTAPESALPIAQAMIAGKLHNQAVVLRRQTPMDVAADATETGSVDAAVQTLRTQMQQAAHAPNAETLRGYEGSGAAAYFAVWARLFDARAWSFRGRAYYPPPDPVNALLSLGYTLLLHDVASALYRIGLDPDIGVLHTLDYGRPSLALDLEEEFRPVVVDTLVLRLIRERFLEPGDFRTPPEQADRRSGVWLTDDARRFFITQYAARLAVRVQHPAWQQQLTYRQCIQRQAEHLARCILGRDAAYTPLLIR